MRYQQIVNSRQFPSFLVLYEARSLKSCYIELLGTNISWVTLQGNAKLSKSSAADCQLGKTGMQTSLQNAATDLQI